MIDPAPPEGLKFSQMTCSFLVDYPEKIHYSDGIGLLAQLARALP